MRVAAVALLHAEPHRGARRDVDPDLSVVVGPVSMPAVVDRPEIVVSTGPNQVRLDEFNRWASPLQDNIARVVAENLVALLGTPRVTLFPQTLNADADYRVAIEVQTLPIGAGRGRGAGRGVDRAPDEGRQDGDAAHHRARDGPDKGYDALAAAHSRALARLSQDIADAVRALDRSGQSSRDTIALVERAFVFDGVLWIGWICRISSMRSAVVIG